MILRSINPKRHNQILWLLNWSYQGVQMQKIQETGSHLTMGNHRRALSFQSSRGWGQFSIITLPSSTVHTHSFYVKQNKTLTDCIAFKQQNNMDKWQETGLTQHTFRVSKGYHSIALVIHCENRLARQLKFFFHFFPQSLKHSPQSLD